MFLEGSCFRIEIFWGVFNDTPIWDIYEVGSVPSIMSTNSPFRKKEIKNIQIENLQYATVALVYYEEGMEYIDKVTRIYGKAQSRSAQGESSDIS